MQQSDELLSLIGDIYEAALDDTVWRRVMERMLALTDSQGATFSIIDNSSEPRFTTLASVNFSNEIIAEYMDGWALHDPTILAIAAHPEQKIFHDSALISEREKDRHAYYDWHRGHSDTRHRIAGIASPDQAIQSGITIHRTRAKGDFDAEGKRLFIMLFQHIERALLIGFRLGTLGNLNDVFASLLDGNPIAIVLLDDRGGIVLANRAAANMGAEADGVTLTADTLSLARPADNQKLQNLVGNALRSIAKAGVAPGGVMTAARPSGKRPYSIIVSPLSRGSFSLATLRAAVCVAIADPEREPVLPVGKLRVLYGLTPAEARLAIHLANGEDLRAAADALGIAYTTARVQLSAIFRKTGTNRQAALVKLLLTSSPILTE